MTTEEEEDPTFPIYDGAVGIGSKRIKHIHPDAKKEVCALAPDPARQPLNQDALWLLNKVENRDEGPFRNGG
jgi:hypothetical protein